MSVKVDKPIEYVEFAEVHLTGLRKSLKFDIFL
jgi:hypothetical protein